MKTYNTTAKETDPQVLFQRTGGLTRMKLLEYLPALVLTNLSVLLLVTVDGLVVGNLRGADALASISMAAPVEFFLGSLSILIAGGSGMCLATAMGRNDQKGVLNIKKAIFLTTILGALISAAVEIPIAYGMIHLYDMDPSVKAMAWQYAIGLMIAAPFGLISTVGVYQLQSAGKMSILARLSVMEGIINLLLDLLFVGVLDMGAGGAGLGTAGATLIRCGVTVVYIHKKTDMFRWGSARVQRKDVLDILRYGVPDMANMAMMSVREYLLVAIIVHEMSTDGAVIYGVAGFCFTLANMFVSGVQGSARPLLGLLIGAEDWQGLRILMRQCLQLMTILLTITTLFFEIAPGLIFRLYGQTEIPETGLMSLRFNCLFLVFFGLNTMFRVYFANRKDTAFTTGIIIVSNIAKPAFAVALTLLFPPVSIWLCFLLAELLILPINLRRYFHWVRRDEENRDPDELVISMSVKPENAVELSQQIRAFATERGIPERIAFHMGFCLEDMVLFATELQKKRPIIDELQIQIIIWLRHNEGRFLMIDNGECLELEAVETDSEDWKMLESKYAIAKRAAASVEYQHLLGLNYSLFRFE